MRGNWFVRFLLLGLTFVPACGLVRPASPTTQALPSPQSIWTLELTQSGGFVGVSLWVQVTSAGQLTATDRRSGRTATETLPPNAMAQLRRLIAQAGTSSAVNKPSSCADCFIYDLALTSESGTAQMQADDVTLGSSGAQALIAYLLSLRDSALATQP